MSALNRSPGILIFLGKAVKVVGIFVAVVAMALLVAHFSWKYSGSNQWRLISEQDGVKLYALKAPGSVRKQFKAIAQIKGTTTAAVSAMLDADLKACMEWIPGCSSVQAVEIWDP